MNGKEFEEYIETLHKLDILFPVRLSRYLIKEDNMLDKDEIKVLEEKYGKHNFCYQCGNPELKPINVVYLPPEYMYCPVCGSSDEDE